VSKSRHIQRKDNEGWAVKSHEPFQITCCDCGLAHTFVLATKTPGEEIGIAAKRDNRVTGQIRRHKKHAKT